MEHSLGAVAVHAIAIDHRRAARAVVVAIQVFVVRGILELPQLFARFRVRAVHAGRIAEAIELEEPAAADGRHAVTGAEGSLPDELGPGGRPLCKNAGFGRFGVAAAAEKRRPIDAGLPRSEARRFAGLAS